MQSLQVAHERFNARITLVVPEATRAAIKQMVPWQIAKELRASLAVGIPPW